MTWGDNNTERIQLLRLRKYRPVFYLKLDGPLMQKRRRGSGTLAGDIKEKVAQSLQDFRWSSIPRANLAVSFQFSTSVKQPPAIQNLVKFYLDELRQHVFSDDRQMACIEAEISKGPETSINPNPDSVFIKVERLADYQARFDAAFELERRLGMHPVDNGDEHDFEIDVDQLEAMFPGKSFAFLRKMEAVKKQKQFLGRIEVWDRPGSQSGGFYGTFAHPFVIEVGKLPGPGETASYKEKIRESFANFKQKYKGLSRFLEGVVLDVGITAKGTRVSKDLDNIMRDVVPIFLEQIVEDASFLQGYRVYVNESKRTDLEADLVRVKILPRDAIRDFQSRVKEIVDKAREEIDLW